MKTHKGGCHCGKVKFEVDADIDGAMACNCSICSKSGTLLTFVPVSHFRLLAGEGETTDYQFNKHMIHHLFCKTCGIKSYARGTGPDGKEMRAINVRCLDGIDVERLAVQHYDGKSA